MYSDMTFSSSSDSKAKDFRIKVEPTYDKQKLFISLKSEEFGHSVTLFLTPDVADDFAWHIQSCLRSLDEQVVDV